MQRRFLRLTLLLLLASGLCPSLTGAADRNPPSVKPPDWPEAVRVRNAKMKDRIDRWLADGQNRTTPLHVVYLSCSDQKPFADHTARITRVLTEIQQWFAKQHEAMGFGGVTFSLPRNDNKHVTLHEGKLPFTVESRTRSNLGETHQACNVAAQELLAKSRIDFDSSFVLVITTIPDDKGAAPFFGLIIQDRGYCFAVDTPWLDTNYTQTDGPVVWKGQRIGAANAALIGGMAHEIGHGLGLPHSDELTSQKPYGESLMASGNFTWHGKLRGGKRDSFLLDTDAMLLVARPPFTKQTRGFDKQPKASVKAVHFKSAKDVQIRLTGRIDTDVPVYAVKLFDDPPGNGNYNSVAHAAIPDEKTGEFEITFNPIRAIGEHELRLVLLHVNGRWSQFKSGMTIDKTGKADLTRANRELGQR